MSKCHIVGNRMHWLKCSAVGSTSHTMLALDLLTPDISSFGNSADPDQMSSDQDPHCYSIRESPPQFENRIMARVYVGALRVVLRTKKLHFVRRKWRSEN